MAAIQISRDFLRRVAAKTTGVPYLNEALRALDEGDYRLAAQMLTQAADAEGTRLQEAWDSGQGWRVLRGKVGRR